jgi:signal transduction histidine kinase
MRLIFFNVSVIACIFIAVSLLIFFSSKKISNQLLDAAVYNNTNGSNEVILSFIIRSALIIIVVLILVFLGSLIITEKALIPIKNAWDKQINFTADASHELRTPLAVMQTTIELVMSNSEQTIASQIDWLDNILIENRRMTKLVEDLLLLSRSDTEQQILQLSSFKLDSILKEVISLFEITAKNKHICFCKNIHNDIEFIGDSNRLKQLFVIMIDNALQYTDRGGKVDIQLKKTVRFIEFSISDTGAGIEKADLEKIFYRFYRVDKTRIKNEGGSGLGLSIAKWIVEAHKGKIEVSSKVGKGSTFIVLLRKL